MWGNVVLESQQANLILPSSHSDSKYVINEVCSAPQNPFPSYCRIVVVQSPRSIQGDVSRLIPQDVFASAIMDLASRMCSANAPIGSLTAFIVVVHSPCPSIPLELSLCSIASSFQASLSPIKAMTILDSGVLHQQVTGSRTPTLGWLSIDRRRRLIPVLAGDPMLDQFAVVGVFVSGVQSLHSPIISAACTWFNSCCNVNRSLIPSDGSFLFLHCASASNSSQLVNSLYEAHPNFAKQPFSMRCSEFISCHGSAVTLRPQLVLPECTHPFALAVNQFSQDSSAVSSEFFSGFHEINQLHGISVTDESTHPDRNIVSPFPEPALSLQPSGYPQYQSGSNALDDPSQVFQKQAVPVTSKNVDVTPCAGSNSLGLVQTIIQQQNTISKLQSEKDQLLVRIMELESLLSENQIFQSRSVAIPHSKDATADCSVTPIPHLTCASMCNDSHRICDAVSTAAPDFVASVNVDVPTSRVLNHACSPLPGTSLVKRLTPLSSSTSGSCDSSVEFQRKSDSNLHSTSNSRVIPCPSDCDFSKSSDAPSHCLPPSERTETDYRDEQSFVFTDSSTVPCHQESQIMKTSHLDQVSRNENDSISFTVPKISYTPLSDDDDSEVVTSFPSHVVHCSDESSGSSLS
jgi:hypothetical protein